MYNKPALSVPAISVMKLIYDFLIISPTVQNDMLGPWM